MAVLYYRVSEVFETLAHSPPLNAVELALYLYSKSINILAVIVKLLDHKK